MDIDELLCEYAQKNLYFHPKRRAKSLELVLSREIAACREIRAKLMHFDERILPGEDIQPSGQSSATVLSTDGFVLTNYHCLPPMEFSKQSTIVTYNGESFLLDPRIYFADRKNDLLLLRMLLPKYQGSPSLCLSQTDGIDCGVTILGPDTPIYSVIQSRQESTADMPDTIFLRAKGIAGYSGSPMLSKESALIGIVYGSVSMSKLSYLSKESYLDGSEILCAVPASRIRKFILEAIQYISSRPKRA